MPKLSPEHLHRLHITVSAADHEWLKQNLEPRELSELFRKIIKRLRGKKLCEPKKSIAEILGQENLEEELRL